MKKTEFTFYYLKETDDGYFMESGEATQFGENIDDARNKITDFMESVEYYDYTVITIFDDKESLDKAVKELVNNQK